jgi:formylglycine-generating enzyme required for sulfatase activity
MGAQKDRPDLPNYDPDAKEDEGPVSEIQLTPFFMSKFEMTQGQWRHVTGKNPSEYSPGKKRMNRQSTLCDPVESVTWEQCVRMLQRLNLVLPTETQWEFAARAGTEDPWSTGADKTALQFAANVADLSYRNEGAPRDTPVEPWNDGYSMPAPVGTYAPNAFGLHDMHGNVFEWCLDGWDMYNAHQPRPGDGLRDSTKLPLRIHRGGSWQLPAGAARSAYRGYGRPDMLSPLVGLRAARMMSE